MVSTSDVVGAGVGRVAPESDVGEETTEKAVSKTKAAVSEVKDEIVKQAKEAAGVVRDQAEKMVDRGKEVGADKVAGYVGVARSAAEDLEEHSPTGARYIREAADGIEELSSSLREKSIGEIVDVVQDFARRKPVIFFGSTLLAGFAILRFVKSSSERQIGQSAQSTVFGASEEQAKASGAYPEISPSADEPTPPYRSGSQGGLPS